MVANSVGADDKVSKSGDTMYGPLTLTGTPPLIMPGGAEAGWVATADAEGNITLQPPTGGSGGSSAKRVTALTASGATYTPNCATTDVAVITTPAANFTVASPSGTPADGQVLIIRILSGAKAYTPSWGTAYSGSTAVPLPSACTVSATDYLGFAWNATASKWHLLSYAPGY